jgi:hypothetical protein
VWPRDQRHGAFDRQSAAGSIYDLSQVFANNEEQWEREVSVWVENDLCAAGMWFAFSRSTCGLIARTSPALAPGRTAMAPRLE